MIGARVYLAGIVAALATAAAAQNPPQQPPPPQTDPSLDIPPPLTGLPSGPPHTGTRTTPDTQQAPIVPTQPVTPSTDPVIPPTGPAEVPTSPVVPPTPPVAPSTSPATPSTPDPAPQFGQPATSPLPQQPNEQRSRQ